jgi:hypothetical protein
MKKSIVLLISLFFIAAVSLLIMKNLEDTDLYLSEQNSKFSKTQIMFFLDNTKDEIVTVLKQISEQYSDDKTKQREVLKDYVGVNFPIFMEDAKIIMRLEEYDKYNINLLKESKDKEADAEKYKYFKDFLARENIYNFEDLQDIYSENNKVENSKQLDFVLEKFEKESYKTDISGVKDYIGFQDYDKKEITQNYKEKEINFYELFVEVEYLKQFVKAYYILDKSGGVKYFEFSFK